MFCDAAETPKNCLVSEVEWVKLSHLNTWSELAPPQTDLEKKDLPL